MVNFGRDYSWAVADIRAKERATDIPGRIGEAMLGWPDWLDGQVGVIFATLYATAASCHACQWDVPTYSTSAEAYAIFQDQLAAYHRLLDSHPDKFYLIKTRADLEAGLTGWTAGRRRLGLVLLIEGAEGVREPEELEAWFAQGVRVIGPAWQTTRYAKGPGEAGGFTSEGRRLLKKMADLGIILDLSHLSDDAVKEALVDFPGTLIASHSNARALLPHSQPARNLTDAMIRDIAAREGIIGIVFFNEFVKDGFKMGDPREQVGLADVIAHIDYMAQLVGHTRHIGLGSDLDGGYGLADSPTGLDSIADLGRIGEALDRRGYAVEDIERILSGNWLRLLRETLPVD